MNTTSKFVVLSALAVLMIGATMVLAVGSADARDVQVRNIGDRNIGQQNTGDTSADSSQDDDNDFSDTGDATANGGNFVGNDQTIDCSGDDGCNNEED